MLTQASDQVAPEGPDDLCGEIVGVLDDIFDRRDWCIRDRGWVDGDELVRQYKTGAISLETRVWSRWAPGWRALDDVWELAGCIQNRAAPPEAGEHATAYLKGWRGWWMRRRAWFNRWRLRVFDRDTSVAFYRVALENCWPLFVAGPSPERVRVARRWWRWAKLPRRSWSKGLRPPDVVEAVHEAWSREKRTSFCAPGWLRGWLAGNASPFPPIWIQWGRRLRRRLGARSSP